MLEVTQEALLHLLHTLQAQQVPDNVAMRLSAGGAGALELFPDQEQAGDRGFDIDGRTVLVVAKDLAESLGGQRLVVAKTGSGQAQLQLEST